MKTWPTFPVSVRLWLHSDMYFWDPEDNESLSPEVI